MVEIDICAAERKADRRGCSNNMSINESGTQKTINTTMCSHLLLVLSRQVDMGHRLKKGYSYIHDRPGWAEPYRIALASLPTVRARHSDNKYFSRRQGTTIQDKDGKCLPYCAQPAKQADSCIGSVAS